MVSFSGQAQGTIALQCPEVGVTPCGYPFPWQAQGPAPTTAIVLNCPYVGKTPRGYPFPWQAQGPAPTTPNPIKRPDVGETPRGYPFSGQIQGTIALKCPEVGVTPCGYPFPWQAQHQLPSNARCRGKPPWVPSFRAGTGACPYDPKSHQTPGCRGNTPWLPIFRAGTGNKCPQMPDVGVTPCGYPFSGQAQGPAPTTPNPIKRPDVSPASMTVNHHRLDKPIPSCNSHFTIWIYNFLC